MIRELGNAPNGEQETEQLQRVSPRHIPGTDTDGADLSDEQLVFMYRVMYLSRRVDDREIILKKQQKIFFQMSSAGHEAMNVAAGMVLRPAYDWFYPYYRDRALCLALGASVAEQLLQAVGAASDVASGGRMMPSHWGNRKLNIVSQSSPTGTQCLQAVGCAEAGRYFAAHPGAADRSVGDYREFSDVRFESDEVVYVSLGEGTTSQGEFWEAMSTASNLKLPVLFVVEDNGFAISVPVEVNTPGGNISRLVSNFPNFHFAEIDGTDALASYEAFRTAVAYCRSGCGPAFVHGHVTRPYSHSTSDDERAYKYPREREAERLLDPIPKMRMLLLDRKILSVDSLLALEASVEAEIDEAVALALRAPVAETATVEMHVYSEDLSPCTLSSQATETAIKSISTQTMAEAINTCLREEMRHDRRIVVFGEDVADCSRVPEQGDAPLKGKGGVFGLTAGLQSEFGSDRVFNTPLAEANIMGRAVGYATRGMKPVIEIQFMDYIWPAMQQLQNEMSVMRWRSNGQYSSPAVVRVAMGGYLSGGGIYHSQSSESIFTHIPGLRVVCPSNAADAYGLLRMAIRCADPVLFLEHKHLYRDRSARGVHPGSDYMLPFGKAATVRSGTDITVVTFGALVQRTIEASVQAQRDYGISVEVVDLRSLHPYDWQAISSSVKKTSRVMVVHEDRVRWGYGAELAARIADELFYSLDAPVRRIGAKETFVAYQPILEAAILPQSADILKEICTLYGE